MSSETRVEVNSSWAEKFLTEDVVMKKIIKEEVEKVASELPAAANYSREKYDASKSKNNVSKKRKIVNSSDINIYEQISPAGDRFQAKVSLNDENYADKLFDTFGRAIVKSGGIQKKGRR